MKRRTFLHSSGLISAGLIMASTLPAFAQDADAPMEFTPLITDMVLGDPSAPIEIVEYSSYTCPHCADYHNGPFKEIKKDYVDTGKAKIVYREVYFDRVGLWASMLARCSGPERFFGITEELYAKRDEWLKGEPPEIIASLRKIGLVAGMTAEEIDACYSDEELAKNLVAWYQENVTRDEIKSTPSFIIQGQQYSNMPLSEFRAVLDSLE